MSERFSVARTLWIVSNLYKLMDELLVTTLLTVKKSPQNRLVKLVGLMARSLPKEAQNKKGR